MSEQRITKERVSTANPFEDIIKSGEAGLKVFQKLTEQSKTLATEGGKAVKALDFSKVTGLKALNTQLAESAKAVTTQQRIDKASESTKREVL